jgi:hypothetical protein
MNGHMLERQIARFQRRAIQMALIKYTCAGQCAASSLTAGAVLAGALPASSGGWVAAAHGAALLLAAGVAFARRPLRSAIAAMIDRRAGLADRAATAVRVRESAEPIDALIVADACRRLEGVAAPSLFPFNLRLPALAAAAAVVQFLLLTYMHAAAPTQIAFERASGLNPRTSGGGRVEDSARERDSAAARVVRAQPERASAAGRQQADQPASGSPPSPTQSAAVPHSRGEDGGDPMTVKGGGMASVATRPAPGTAAGNDKVAASGDRFPSNVGAVAAGGSASGASGRGGRAAAAGEHERGGGVARGGLAADAQGQHAPSAAPRGARAGAAYRGRWNAAMASLAADDVPLQRRDYLRSYFMAIRPSEDR